MHGQPEPEVTDTLVTWVLTMARLVEVPKPTPMRANGSMQDWAEEKFKRMTYCTTACQMAVQGWGAWPDHTQRVLLNRVYQAVWKTREAPWRG